MFLMLMYFLFEIRSNLFLSYDSKENNDLLDFVDDNDNDIGDPSFDKFMEKELNLLVMYHNPNDCHI